MGESMARSQREVNFQAPTGAAPLSLTYSSDATASDMSRNVADIRNNNVARGYQSDYYESAPEDESDSRNEVLATSALDELIAEAERMEEEGNRHMAEQEYAQAYNIFSAAIHLSLDGPSSHIYYTSRATSLLYLKRFVAAEQDARAAVRLRPTNGHAQATLGQALYFQKKYEEAEAAYKTAVTLDPNDEVGWIYLAKSKDKIDRREVKRRVKRTMREARTAKVQQSLALHMLQQGDPPAHRQQEMLPDEDQSVTQSLMTNLTDDTHEDTQLEFLREQQRDIAEKQHERLLVKRNRERERLAALASKLDLEKAALRRSNSLLEPVPTRPPPRGAGLPPLPPLPSRASSRRMDVSTPEEDADDDAKDRADALELHREGTDHMDKQEFQMAVDKYSAAIWLCPDEPDVSSQFYLSRTSACLAMADYTEASKDSERAVNLSPSDPNCHASLGRAKYLLEDYEGAVAAYREVQRLVGPEANMSALDAAYLDEASRALELIAEDAVEDAGDLDGDEHLERHEVAELAAAKFRERAVKASPLDPARHVSLGRALYDIGDYDGAVAAYTEAMRLMGPGARLDPVDAGNLASAVGAPALAEDGGCDAFDADIVGDGDGSRGSTEDGSRGSTEDGDVAAPGLPSTFRRYASTVSFSTVASASARMTTNAPILKHTSRFQRGDDSKVSPPPATIGKGLSDQILRVPLRVGPEHSITFGPGSLGVRLNRGCDGTVRVLSTKKDDYRPGDRKLMVGDVIREAAGINLSCPISSEMWEDTVDVIRNSKRPMYFLVAKEFSERPPEVVAKFQQEADTAKFQQEADTHEEDELSVGTIETQVVDAIQMIKSKRSRTFRKDWGVCYEIPKNETTFRHRNQRHTKKKNYVECPP